MHSIDLALKDLLQIFRDWKAALFLLIMPIGFTLVFGFAFGGFGDGNENADSRLPVGIVNQDDGQLAEYFLDMLGKSSTIRPVILETTLADEEINTMIDNDDYAAIVVIHPGYGDSLVKDEPQQLTAVTKPNTSSGATVQGGLETAINRLSSSISAAQFSTEARDQIQPFQDDNNRQEYFYSSLERAITTWDHPPFELIETQTGAPEEEPEEAGNAFAQSSTGMMIQFAIAGLIGAAEVIVLERKSGSLKRLLTTSISRTEILLGHFLAMFMMILVQFMILIGFAAIFLDVAYFSKPLATIVIMLATTFFTASMGLLIGALAKNEEQAIMFSLIPMFILSGFGGAWVPLEFTSETFQLIGHFTPVAWALDGFQNIVMRGMGLESVLLPSLVLLGFSAICIALSIWRFKFE